MAGGANRRLGRRPKADASLANPLEQRRRIGPGSIWHAWAPQMSLEMGLGAPSAVFIGVVNGCGEASFATF